jgi:dTDP-4-dehydrorhamnose reductase
MIWLVGNKGMLGTEVERELSTATLEYVATDMDCDITNPSAVRDQLASSGASWVVNCAAYTNVDGAEDDEETAFRINADAVENLAGACREHGAALLHLSTDYVFGGERAEPYEPDDEMNPVGAYGRSKAEGERRVREKLAKHIIIRTAWLYGRNGKNFVSTMLRLFESKDELTVVSDQHGSPTYAVDLARAIVRILAAGAGDGSVQFGTYHFTNEGRTTWYEFACEIQRQAAAAGMIDREIPIRPVPSSEYPTRAKRPTYSYLSKEAIQSAFDLAIPDWHDALARYLEELRRTT